jgi:hypothetical protein
MVYTDHKALRSILDGSLAQGLAQRSTISAYRLMAVASGCNGVSIYNKGR